MADEEKQDIQAKIEFIIDQQAQFAANIQAHDERFTRLENIVTRMAEASLGGIETLNAKLSLLIDTQIKLEDGHKELQEAQKRTEGALERLAESQAHTDKRLDALIDIVREDRERRNEKP
jgi:hypothetical protein